MPRTPPSPTARRRTKAAADTAPTAPASVTVADPVAVAAHTNARSTRVPKDTPKRAASARTAKATKPAKVAKVAEPARPARPVKIVQPVKAAKDAAPKKSARPKGAAPAKRTRKLSARETADLDHGFVPKAPPPTALPSTGLAPHRSSGTNAAEAGGPAPESPGSVRLTSVAQSRHVAPDAPSRPIAPDADGAPRPTVAVSGPIGPAIGATAGSRIQCQACAYPLPRTARFCRRCGIAQHVAPAASPVDISVATAVTALMEGPSVKETRAEGTSAPREVPAHPAPSEMRESATAPDTAPPATSAGTAAIACAACGFTLPGHAKFCRGCGALQVTPEPATAEQVHADHGATPSVADAAPVEEAPAGTPPAAAVAPGSETADVEAVQEATAEPAPAEASAPVLAVPATRHCRSCDGELPLIARFCMFCAAPQHDEAAPPPASDAEIAATDILPPSHSVDHAVPESPPEPVMAEAAVLQTEPAPEPALMVPDAPPPEPAPLRISSLAPDVVERLAQTRHEIDSIGRSLAPLTRPRPAHSPLPSRHP